MSIARACSRPAFAGFLTAALLLVTASAAGAQTPAVNAPAPPPTATVTTAPVIPAPAASDPYWALIAGYEWDTHGSSYGFVGPHYTHPFGSGDVAWTARVFGNYLRYEFSDTTKTTKVRAPGASASVGLKFGTKNYFAVSAGPSVSWRKTTVTPNVGAETEPMRTFGLRKNPYEPAKLHHAATEVITGGGEIGDIAEITLGSTDSGLERGPRRK